jgi:glutamate-1-semialdehyde 2,1-aminomutase
LHLKTLYLQELMARGFLCLGTHNMSYAHSEADVTSLLSAYDDIIPVIVGAVRDGSLEKLLHARPLEPLFKVR